MQVHWELEFANLLLLKYFHSGDFFAFFSNILVLYYFSTNLSVPRFFLKSHTLPKGLFSIGKSVRIKVLLIITDSISLFFCFSSKRIFEGGNYPTIKYRQLFYHVTSLHILSHCLKDQCKSQILLS